ncbi:MAG: ilvC [Brevibacillus sp.]|nr:ilvC [Brevibacillus sp.]
MSNEKELMDAAPAYLRGKVVAIFAYEDLGLEQAQRLREQGIQVIVTLRQGSSLGRWMEEGFCLVSLWDAADQADVFQVW